MTKSTEFSAVKSNCWFCFYWSHPWKKCPIGKRKYKTRDIKSVLCRCICLWQHGWKGVAKSPLCFFALMNSRELSSQHPKTNPSGGTFLRRQGFLAVQPLTFSKIGRRNVKKVPVEKETLSPVLFYSTLTQSERELSSLLKRAWTEAGLALTGPLGTDKNVFQESIEHKRCIKQLALKGELWIFKDWECVRCFWRKCIRVWPLKSTWV